MDFDLSKENIQPLRGGRNVSQLEVALQAQSNEDFQRELLHQKNEFEHAIQSYDGEDPLENWYNYISWVEQSYPKHGHEGNLVCLLEDCLAKFEHDKTYANDFRFCKLWIKYNDLQQNPLELYHMMHARGLCRGCADLYRAWAYYHEAAGDYRNADVVFQLGKRELAQPYEELLMAHQNMVYAAGQQLISGVNEQRLMEQRQALTSLRTYKSGRVGSLRTGNGGAGVLPSGNLPSRSNTVVSVYEDRDEPVRGAEAAPVSILSVARRQVAPKENTIKPGVWTGCSTQWKSSNAHRTPKFIVHEDNEDFGPKGIKLPVDHYPVTHEDFSHWKPMLCYAEPADPSRVPMYPKSKVYSSGETEYSIEEIRAPRYLSRSGNRLNVSHIETEQAIQSILGEHANTSCKEKMQELSQIDGNFYQVQESNVNVGYPQNQQVVFQGDGYQQVCSGGYSPHISQEMMQQPVQFMTNSHSLSHVPHQEHFKTTSHVYQDGVFNQSHPHPDVSHHSVVQQGVSILVQQPPPVFLSD